jgi:hypothetical protein
MQSKRDAAALVVLLPCHEQAIIHTARIILLTLAASPLFSW